MSTALACGTTRTALAMVDTTKSTRTARTISAMILPVSIAGRSLLAPDGAVRWDRATQRGTGCTGGDDSGGAVDADHGDLAADLERVAAGGVAGRPHLARELHPAAVAAHRHEHLALGSDQGGGARRRLGDAPAHVGQQGWAGGKQEEAARPGEDEELDGERGPEGG